MKRLALISDIHGNGIALDAVIADLGIRPVDEIICLGDVAAGGPQPQAVIASLRDLGCPGVRGNADGWLLDDELPTGESEETHRLREVAAWARATLGRAELDYLRALPPTLSVTVEDVAFLCFHGSPRSDVERLLATTPGDELDDVLRGAANSVVFAGGHTHLQLLRVHRDRLLINPGSVGLPLGALGTVEPPLPIRAEYALVEVDGSQVEIAFRRVPIDGDALAALTATMPNTSWAADLERRIRRWNERAS
jgi:putative phosphoesterase